MHDTFHNPRKKVVHLGPRSINIELSRKGGHELYIKYRPQFLGVCSIALLVLVFWTYRLTTRANSATLYPAACLGGWVNPHNAEGKPDVLTGAGTEYFNASNSAALSQNTIAEIYCGSFTGDIAGDVQPKKIVLHFSWASLSSDVTSPTLVTPTSVASSSVTIVGESFASSTAAILDAPASSTPTFTLEEATTSPSAPVAPATDTSAAPDTSTPPSSPSPVPAAVPAPIESAPADPGPSSFLHLFTQTAFAADVDVTSSSSIATTSTAALVSEITPTPTGFLQVDYTLDGMTWQTLGIVDEAHLQTTAFEIPLATSTGSTTLSSAATWRDMSTIQIRVKSLSSFDQIPQVYLDGMSLQVTYGEDDAYFKSASGLYIGKVQTATSSPMHFQVKNDAAQQALVISVNDAPIGGLAVYDASSSLLLLTTFAGDASYMLSPEYFGLGSYDIIRTSDPDNCTHMTLEECRAASVFENQGMFEVVDSNQ